MIICTSTMYQYSVTYYFSLGFWPYIHYTTSGLFVVGQEFLDNGANRPQQLDCSECDQSVHTATKDGVKGLV